MKRGDRVKVKDIDQTNGDMCYDNGVIIQIKRNRVLVKCDYWNSDYNDIAIWFFKNQVKKI